MLHYFFLVFDRVMSVFWTTYCFPRNPSVPTFSVHSKCLFNGYSRPLSIFSCWCNKTTVSLLFSRVGPIPNYLLSYWQLFSQTLQGFFKFRVDFQYRVIFTYIRKIYLRKWNRGNAWNFARQLDQLLVQAQSFLSCLYTVFYLLD